MWKKSVLGLAILVAGLLFWSCGDGSLDPLNDNELMMISRFDGAELRDSVVQVCKQNKDCWEKFEKTREISLGDYYFKLADDSLFYSYFADKGDSISVVGDSTFVWKDGKKIPVFIWSSNSTSDGDGDVTSNGSGPTSGSSSRRSSASGAGTMMMALSTIGMGAAMAPVPGRAPDSMPRPAAAPRRREPAVPSICLS